MSVCNDVQISIDAPALFDDDLDAILDSLSNSGYDVLNPNDSFYQDVCTTYTTPNGTDVILSERKKDVYTETQNKSIRQKGCVLMPYKSKSKKAKI